MGGTTERLITPTMNQLCAVVSRSIATGTQASPAVEPDTDLLLTGLLNSLGVAKIVAELERVMSTQLPQNFVVARNFRSVRALEQALSKFAASQTR